jgi:hypothetical protein
MTTRTTSRAGVIAALALLGACFSPHYDSPTCGPGGECPSGLHCEGDTCVAGGGDIDADPGAIDGTPAPDSDPTGCYHEQADATNATAPESTGKNVPQDVAVICGAFDDKAPDAQGNIDIDSYVVNAPVGRFGIRIAAPNASAFSNGVMIVGAQGQAGVATYAWMGADVGLVTAALTTAGALTIQVVSRGAQLGLAVPYQISVELLDTTMRCASVTALGAEMLDTVANVSAGNDVLTFPQQQPNFPPTLTADGTDTPEAFGTLTGGTRISMTGTTDFAHTVTDIYRDRDTYLLDVAPSVSELDIVIDYTGTEDLDFWLVRTSDLRQQAVGFNIGPEVASVSVAPGQYYLLVGAYMPGAASQPYTLTACGQP